MDSKEKLKMLAKDLSKEFPRSPREMIGGYVIAARAVDKCRADLAGTIGEYHSGCPLDEMFLEFAGISFGQFREFVATGANDQEIGDWIQKAGKSRPRIEIIRWNNEMRGRRSVGYCPTISLDRYGSLLTSWLVTPRSAIRLAPVMQELRSLRRNTQASAISSGSMRRAAGIFEFQ